MKIWVLKSSILLPKAGYCMFRECKKGLVLPEVWTPVVMCDKRNSVGKKRLFFQAIGKFLLGVIIVGLLLFLPAGSLLYWEGFLLMGFLFVQIFCTGQVIMMKNPELLCKRLNAKRREKRPEDCRETQHNIAVLELLERKDNDWNFFQVIARRRRNSECGL